MIIDCKPKTSVNYSGDFETCVLCMNPVQLNGYVNLRDDDAFSIGGVPGWDRLVCRGVFKAAQNRTGQVFTLGIGRDYAAADWPILGNCTGLDQEGQATAI